MKSGSGMRERPRQPGQWTAWGQTVTVEIGATLARPHELVRASVGRPVPWAWALYLEGAVGADAVIMDVTPALGTCKARGGVKGTLTTLAPSLFAPPCGMPATELVITAQVLVAAVGKLRIVAHAAPTTWAHVNPDTMEGQW